MKPFDYNKYMKNNPLLKEDNEGASDEEIEKAIKSYTASDWKKSLWKSSAKKDFESMAKGGASDIKMKLYPKWTPEDFKAVLVSLEDKIK